MAIAFITGANKGIGYATAARLGQAGVQIIVGARDPEKGDAATAALREQGTDAVAVQCDVTDDSSVRAAAEVVRAGHGHDAHRRSLRPDTHAVAQRLARWCIRLKGDVPPA
jgi:NAD(P)-dependent dehydrogenase (short-subunit alcohol dehydrogenase family)